MKPAKSHAGRPSSPERRSLEADCCFATRKRPMRLRGSTLTGASGTTLPASPAGMGVSPVDQNPLPPATPGRDYTPVITPNGATLPWKVVDGVKVMHLIAEEDRARNCSRAEGKVLGLQWPHARPDHRGRRGGPRAHLCHQSPARADHRPLARHLVPNGMDGVSGLTQKPIPPGETFKYEFTLRQHGTHMYHPHFDEMTQIALGMEGMFIIHPRESRQDPRPDRDFAIMLSEWRIDPGTSRPNPMEMVEFNMFTMNSKAFPGTEPLVAKLGDRVRVRLATWAPMDHHPIHLHGYDFIVTDIDGGFVPESARVPGRTRCWSRSAQTRAFEFVANEPGDWAMHCHMTHHMMNQMGHDAPNMVGVKPGKLDEKVPGLLPGYMTMGGTGMGGMAMMGMPVPKNSIPMGGGTGPFATIDMGGMFTILKVARDNDLRRPWLVPTPAGHRRHAGNHRGVEL